MKTKNILEWMVNYFYNDGRQKKFNAAVLLLLKVLIKFEKLIDIYIYIYIYIYII
jgi:hypothetical protein